MKRTSTFVSFLLLSCCSFLQLTQSSTNDLVDDICKKSPNLGECRAIVLSNPQATKYDIVAKMVNDILARATKRLIYAQRFAIETKDIELRQKFVSCAKTYGSLVDYYIRSIIDFTNQKRYELVGEKLIFIKGEIGRCNRQIKNSTGRGSISLSALNKKLQRFIDIAVAIVKQL
ncbi:plant invertase/pectin methylesterase inhibitor [Medicago truncatula]|uniref:Plant invertase/pectin methylesterase inhibitor n=1 Tax=Medicago truncatula TaxID=3880 RepID=A0A072URE0_MEDTR|nr:plant invertase/pectin methylesterase inhibitor [Medicago truncatula]